MYAPETPVLLYKSGFKRVKIISVCFRDAHAINERPNRQTLTDLTIVVEYIGEKKGPNHIAMVVTLTYKTFDITRKYGFSSSLLLLVPREGRASCLWHYFGIYLSALSK